MQKISVITATKSLADPKLKDLQRSLKRQTYKNWEHIIVTEGNPESAKAIGLKKATGEIICIVASDCRFPCPDTFREAIFKMNNVTGCYSERYHYDPNDPILNRYFALFGCNDPIPLYLGKCDRRAYYMERNNTLLSFSTRVPTLGDNGFFIWKDILKKADIKNYSHIDVCEDLRKIGHHTYHYLKSPTHHQTGDSLWQWAKKRLHYANTLNNNRRWKMISNWKDMILLGIFVLSALTVVEPTLKALYGYLKSDKKDKAWFLHPIVCFVTVFVYIPYVVRRLCVRT